MYNPIIMNNLSVFWGFAEVFLPTSFRITSQFIHSHQFFKTVIQIVKSTFEDDTMLTNIRKEF